MMRCSARLDRDAFFGSDDKRAELNGDRRRRRRAPGSSPPPPTAAAAASGRHPPKSDGPSEVTSSVDASTAERWRRTAVAWLTLAMNEDLMDARVAAAVVDLDDEGDWGDVVLALGSSFV